MASDKFKVESSSEQADPRGANRFSFTVEFDRGAEQQLLKSNSLTRLNGMLTHDMIYHGAVASLLSHQGVALPRLVSLDDEQLTYGFQRAAQEIQTAEEKCGYLTPDYYARLDQKLSEIQQESPPGRPKQLRARAAQAVLAMEVAGLHISRLLLEDAPLTSLLREGSDVQATITNESGEGVLVRINSSETSPAQRHELRLDVEPPLKNSDDEQLVSHLQALSQAVEQPYHEWIVSKTR